MNASDVRRALGPARMTLLLADVLGGWDGLSWGANTALVFCKGSDPNVSKSFMTDVKQSWSHDFSAYCNHPSTPWDRKSLGWFRALSRGQIHALHP